jgi:hypothetical protein
VGAVFAFTVQGEKRLLDKSVPWRSTALLLILLACGPSEEPGAPRETTIEQALDGRGRIALVGITEEDVQGAAGDFVQPTDAIRAALDADDSAALLRALDEDDIQGVALSTTLGTDPEAHGLAARIARFEHIDGLRGAFLHPGAVLYMQSVVASLGRDVELAAPIARRLLEGAPRPRMSSFPASYRADLSVEVMVLLRDRGRARLWRSARGSSIAAALVTAATVARRRWREREQALGGPLEERLLDLDVEVSLLEEDGTLALTTDAFVERVFGEEHGVAFESTSNWRYLLPDATAAKGDGSAVAAYHQLFQEDSLPEDSLENPGLRFYRLVVTVLGVDVGGVDGLSGEGVLDAIDSASDAFDSEGDSVAESASDSPVD